MEIDPRFKAAKHRAARRRRKTWLLPLMLWGAGSLFLAGAGLGLYFSGLVTFGSGRTQVDITEIEDGVADTAASYRDGIAGTRYQIIVGYRLCG